MTDKGPYTAIKYGWTAIGDLASRARETADKAWGVAVPVRRQVHNDDLEDPF